MLEDTKEVIFEIVFAENTTQQQVDVFWTYFVKMIEKNNLLWGGGGDHHYLRGGISHKDDDKFDETQIKHLLSTLSEEHAMVESLVMGS